MKELIFDTSVADSQGTVVVPLKPEDFDISAYEEYCARLEPRAVGFNGSDSGVLVYRRFRVPEVYSGGCADREYSLGLQLAALRESMKFDADLPNFLEPWYGIGTCPASFGARYNWRAGQAPATEPLFASVAEALSAPALPIAETETGKSTLEMIEYFLEKTKGRIPMSLSDVQSPLNAAAAVVRSDALYLDIYDDPDAYDTLLDRITGLMLDFYKREREMIPLLAAPGHGFASSTVFRGIGVSDDNSCMLSGEHFIEHEIPRRARMGEAFGGLAFHSCGDWARLIPAVLQIPGLVMADGAFTPATDPQPNRPEAFRDAFSGAECVLHVRMVGAADDIEPYIRRIWKKPMRLIVCTYCKTPEDQRKAYEMIHEICN